MSAAQAQRDADAPIPKDRLTLRETIDVRLVHLDAVVTDRSGEPLFDLQPSDFHLRVDGQRVEVTSVSQGRELRETLTGRLTLVVFLDLRHLQKSHLDLLLDEITQELVIEMTESPTWVAVTALSDRLEPLLAPTRDIDAVLGAMERAKAIEIEPSDLRNLQRAVSMEVRDLLRQLARSGSTYRFGRAALNGVASRARSYGEVLARDTLDTLAGIESLVEALSFVPGRKAVLFLTDGIPREPLDHVAETMHDRLAGGSVLFEGDEIVSDRGKNMSMNDTKNRPTGSDRLDGSGATVYQEDDGGAYQFQRIVADLSCSKQFDHLAALANTHRVTFYPLKPPIIDPRLSGLGERQGDRGAITALSDMLDGLQKLAAATGGLAFSSQKGVVEFLRRTRDDVSTYYSLSFTPPESMRGSGIRHMELKIRRKKARIRHRASYVSISLEQNLASRAWGTLLFDWQENKHGLEIRTAIDTTGGGDTAQVEILLSLPISRLKLVSNGRVVAGSFRMVVTLLDGNGARRRPQHLGFVVEVPEDDLDVANEQFFAVRTQIDLGPGSYDMVIGLWEENTASSSFVTHKIVVQSTDPSVAQLERKPAAAIL